jgi:transposase-like protein
VADKKASGGRGAEGKKNVLIACESKDKKVGFIAMAVVDSICHFSVNKFVKKHLKLGQKVYSDALLALNIIDQTQVYEARVTPSHFVDEWLMCSYRLDNLKTLWLGTFHGVSGKYLQEYLDEFCYRFNRHFIEKQISNRLFI